MEGVGSLLCSVSVVLPRRLSLLPRRRRLSSPSLLAVNAGRPRLSVLSCAGVVVHSATSRCGGSPTLLPSWDLVGRNKESQSTRRGRGGGDERRSQKLRLERRMMQARPAKLSPQLRHRPVAEWRISHNSSSSRPRFVRQAGLKGHACALSLSPLCKPR